MPKYKMLRLILGDQLNKNRSWFKNPDSQTPDVIMEIRPETDYVRHHIQKAATLGEICPEKLVWPVSRPQSLALLAGVSAEALDAWYLRPAGPHGK